MTAFKRGDIVLVPFPFSDQTAIKKRPAVVISSDSHNNSSLDVVIMAVTSKVEKHSNAGDCPINDYKSAGLLKPSSIKPAISTIEQSLVIKKLGKLSSADMDNIEKALKKLLSL
ncbi:MAG: type II toxin-antitoxin system PemK/MazF family toxin [bacterium]